MAYGLQIWDSGGNITLDISDRITRILSTYTGTLNYPSGYYTYLTTISVPGLLANGQVFCSIKFTDNTNPNDLWSAYSYIAESMDIYSNSYKYSAGTITYYITLLGY